MKLVSDKFVFKICALRLKEELHMLGRSVFINVPRVPSYRHREYNQKNADWPCKSSFRATQILTYRADMQQSSGP